MQESARHVPPKGLLDGLAARELLARQETVDGEHSRHMELEFVPLLPIQRELYQMPRGRDAVTEAAMVSAADAVHPGLRFSRPACQNARTVPPAALKGLATV